MCSSSYQVWNSGRGRVGEGEEKTRRMDSADGRGLEDVGEGPGRVVDKSGDMLLVLLGLRV